MSARESSNLSRDECYQSSLIVDRIISHTAIEYYLTQTICMSVVKFYFRYDVTASTSSLTESKSVKKYN